MLAMAVRASTVGFLANFLCTSGNLAFRREGEDYMLELADEVIANEQSLLPIPYEIVKGTPTDRDVGYLGEHPIDEQFQVALQVGSLQTVRDLQGFYGNTVIARVLVKDSKKTPYPKADYRWTGRGGKSHRHLNGLVNPTDEQVVWQWQKNRWFAVREWFEHLSYRDYDKMVILHSSGDVLYGGCDENSINYKYETIINASGGTQKIVLAAEVSPFPSDLGYRYEMADGLEATRLGVLAAFGVQPTWISGYADCTNETFGPCGSRPYKYQYASSGFIMGPANEIWDMLEDLATWTSPENRLINEYFLHNLDKVALDYAGILSMSLHNLKPGTGLPVEVTTSGGKKVIQSKVTGMPVCFVYGNGNSFGSLKDLATQLKA